MIGNLTFCIPSTWRLTNRSNSLVKASSSPSQLASPPVPRRQASAQTLKSFCKSPGPWNIESPPVHGVIGSERKSQSACKSPGPWDIESPPAHRLLQVPRSMGYQAQLRVEVNCKSPGPSETSFSSNFRVILQVPRPIGPRKSPGPSAHQ